MAAASEAEVRDAKLYLSASDFEIWHANQVRGFSAKLLAETRSLFESEVSDRLKSIHRAIEGAQTFYRQFPRGGIEMGAITARR